MAVSIYFSGVAEIVAK